MRAIHASIVASLLVLLGAAVIAWLTGSMPDPGSANVVPLILRTPHAGFNRLVVAIMVCVPGTERCATIDDVMVDTGSTGLRLEASAVPADLAFPAFAGPNQRPLAECLHFVHDDAWGRLYRVDLRIGGMAATNLPIQIIDDGDRPDQPESCPRSTVRPTSNGTLGIGPQLTDCAGNCQQSATRPGVYTCGAEGCRPFGGPVAPAYRLPNPVSRFHVHNNGILIDLPAAPPGGTIELSGTLTFGVGTGRNNQIGAASVVTLDDAGRFGTRYGADTYPESYIDSGTATYLLPDRTLPRCEGMEWAFCVVPERRLKAEMIGRDGSSSVVPFTVGDYGEFRSKHFGASDSVAIAAEPSSRAFVWGAPFFIGKRVAVVMTGATVPAKPGLFGPLYAVAAR